MIEAFYSGTAGLHAHQTALDTLANNMANVNTTAYKTQNPDFEGLLGSSMMQPATPNAAALIASAGGGVLGVQEDTAAGVLQNTDSNTDYAVDGDGYFAARAADGTILYTRDGSFHRGADGALLTQQGYAVLGADGTPATGKTAPGVFAFANSAGLIPVGNNDYAAGALSGAATASAAAVRSGVLESSNVDMGAQMARLITTQRGFQLSASAVTTADDVESMTNDLGR